MIILATKRLAARLWLTFAGVSLLAFPSAQAQDVTVKTGTLAIGTGTNKAGVCTGLGTGTVYLGDTTGSAQNASLLLPNNMGSNSYITIANNIVVQAGNAGQAIIGGTIPLDVNTAQTAYTINFTRQVTLNKDVVLSPYQSMYGYNAGIVAGMQFNNLTGAGGIIVSGTGLATSSSGQGYGIATGCVTLVGPNDYQGDTKILSGVLQLGSYAACGDLTPWVGTSANAIVLGDTAGVQSVRFHVNATGTTQFTRNFITQAGSGGIAVISENSGWNWFTGNITLNKTIYLNAGAGNGGSALFAGTIADGANAIGGMGVAVSSVQAGSAAVANVTLWSANTYDGGTIVGNGYLSGSSTGAFGAGNVYVETGILRVSGSTNLAANKTIYAGPYGSISAAFPTANAAAVPGYLQTVVDKSSSGGILLGSGNKGFAPNLDLSQIGNGLMYFGVDGGIASTTYNGTALGANSDGNYRLGFAGNNAVLTITNNVLVDGTNGGNTHAQLIVGSSLGNTAWNRVGAYTYGQVQLNGTNTFSGNIVVNNNSKLYGTQALNAGASPFGSSANTLTLHNSTVTLYGNGVSTVSTTLGDLTFDGHSSIGLTTVTGGTNALTVGNITRSGSGTLVIGTYNSPSGGTLGGNVILKTSGAAPATVAQVDANGSGTGLSNMVAPYYVDAFGNYLSYNATTGFTPIVSTIITTDGLTGTNAVVKTVTNGPTTIVVSSTIAALSLGGNLVSAANTDLTLKITTGGLNNLSYSSNVQSSSSSMAIGSPTTTGRINLDFNGQEAVIMNTSNQNGGMIIYNNITNTGGNGLTKGGFGQLYLASTTNDFTGTITINGIGDNAYGSSIKITADSQLGNVNNGIVFNGGNLLISGQTGTVTLSSTRKVTIGANGGYFYFEGATNNVSTYENLTVAGAVTGTGSMIAFCSTAASNSVVSSTVTLSNTANDFQAPIYVGLGATGRILLTYSDDRQLGNASNVVTLVGGNSGLQYTGAGGYSMSRGINMIDQGGGIDITNNVTVTENGPITGSGIFSLHFAVITRHFLRRKGEEAQSDYSSRADFHDIP